MQLRHITSTILLTLAVSAPLHAAEKSSGIKCWTNKQGIRECGNEVPPEYAQGRTETVNKRGMVTNVEERAKTAAEVAEEQRKEGKDASSTAEAAQKKQDEEKQKQEQARYDRMITASFLSEQDIEAARKRKLSAIDASIDLTRTTMTKLQEKLQKQEQKSTAQQKAGKKPSDDQQKELDALKKQIADKEAFIATKEQEKVAINAEYDGYLNRFRELKGR